jgi:hypothetical protein
MAAHPLQGPDSLRVLLTSPNTLKFLPPAGYNSTVSHDVISYELTIANGIIDVGTIVKVINSTTTDAVTTEKLGEDVVDRLKQLPSPQTPSSRPPHQPHPPHPPHPLDTIKHGKLICNELLLTLPKPTKSAIPMAHYTTLLSYLTTTLRADYSDACSEITLVNVNDDMSKITLSLTTENERVTQFNVILASSPNPSSPNANVYTLAIPDTTFSDSTFCVTNLDVILCLKELLTSFVNSCKKYDVFYAEYIPIDRELHVLDPSLPSSSLHRRILCYNVADVEKLKPLSFEFSMMLNDKPRDYPPSVKIHGDNSSNNLLKSWKKYVYDSWDTTVGVYDNILAFDLLTFVRKGECEEDEGGVECGICYSYVLCTDEDDDDENMSDNAKPSEQEKKLDELPDIYCTCGRQYHPSCLREWCITGTGRVVMGRVYGSCAYCEGSICCDAEK